MARFDFLTNNKQLPAQWNYQGRRAPSVGESFRPVQQMITDTLMRRSQGQDVGFDPRRRTELGKIYDIDFNRQKEQRNRDLMNELGGTGQSRNLAAMDALMGRANRWAEDTRSKYMQGIDVEDLARRSQERENATNALQNLNAQNFGQENAAANFDLNEYGQGQNFGLRRAAAYENPWGAAIRTASNVAGTAAQFFPGSSASFQNSPTASAGSGMGYSATSPQAYGQDMSAALRKFGKNLKS